MKCINCNNDATNSYYAHDTFYTTNDQRTNVDTCVVFYATINDIHDDSFLQHANEKRDDDDTTIDVCDACIMRAQYITTK